MTSDNLVFGIDLGTTYSCIAYVDAAGKPVVIPNEENELVTPSVVYFESPGNTIVGKIAKEAARIYPNDVVELIKRSMGDPGYYRNIHGQDYRPEDISAIILRKLKEDAERALERPVTDAVITVPAYFNEAQRTATEQAGRIAGLNVRGIIPEPTAAAIEYALSEKRQRNVLVYDLGGGTFDVTVMEVGPESVRVVAVGGDHDLGGRKWDEALVAYFAEEWKRLTGRYEEPLDDIETAQDFVSQAEKAKKMLTRMGNVPLSLSHAGHRPRIELTRAKFDAYLSLLENTISLTRATLEEARRKGVIHIDRLVLVGGSSNMPQVGRRLLSEFGVECELFDPDQAVAKGAARYAADRRIKDAYEQVIRAFGNNAPKLEDLSPSQQLAATQAVQEIIPDISLERIEEGARRTIVNATSKNFGVVAQDAAGNPVVVYLIYKNSEVPATEQSEFETEVDNQAFALIQIVEAEGDQRGNPPGPRGPECRDIKSAKLELPPGLPRGSIIRVSYSLSEDGGRLRVLAVEDSSGRSIEIDVETVDALTQVEVEQKKERLLKMVVK